MSDIRNPLTGQTVAVHDSVARVMDRAGDTLPDAADPGNFAQLHRWLQKEIAAITRDPDPLLVSAWLEDIRALCAEHAPTANAVDEAVDRMLEELVETDGTRGTLADADADHQVDVDAILFLDDENGAGDAIDTYVAAGLVH